MNKIHTWLHGRWAVPAISGVAIVASGGVKSIADIEALKPYEKAGIEGVIVGKSIYMGTLDLAEAIEIAAKEG